MSIQLRNLKIVFFKELLDITRDRRTLGFMVLLPIVIIPGIFAIMNKITESGIERLREDVSKVAVIGADEAPSMMRLFDNLDRAFGNPAFFAELDDPVLAGGLMHMMSGDEMADAFLIAAAAQEQLEEDDLGDARFLELIPFEASTDAGRDLFSDGVPGFLSDDSRLRLAGAARTLRERELGDDATAEDLGDARLIADHQRIKNLSEGERTALDDDLARLDALGAELTAALEAKHYQAIVVFHAGFRDALANDGTAKYTVLSDHSVDRSQTARRKLSGFLDRLSNGVVRSRLVNGHDLPTSVLLPLSQNRVNLGRDRSVLGMLLPYMVILMCFLGAIFPALDLGAGEKERGTLETLLVTPAHRLELVLGKFLVITFCALIAALLNIGSLTWSLKAGIFELPGAAVVFDPQAVLISILAMLPTAALFAAMMLAVSIFAKSFKEAQSYSGPLQFLIIVPAFASFMPGVELTPKLAAVPLVNVSLALKEAWSGIFQWDCIAILMVSSMVYAGLALAFCVRWFQREEVLFRT